MQNEREKFCKSLFIPLIFLALLWVVKFAEISLDMNLYKFGIEPRRLSGLIGIITTPFVHRDFPHLISNSIPFLILTIGLFYFYRTIAYRVFVLIYLITGILIWLGARDAHHIGASGLVYGFASFLFVSGIIRENHQLATFSLIIAFLYGGFVWGIFPIPRIFQNISWESHLFGLIAGIIIAFYFRKKGPQPDKYEWEEEEEEGKNSNNQ